MLSTQFGDGEVPLGPAMAICSFSSTLHLLLGMTPSFGILPQGANSGVCEKREAVRYAMLMGQ